MKPAYNEDGIMIYHGDCREVLASIELPVDVVVTDPPYGETSLAWDVPADEWIGEVATDQIWCFGSMRTWLRVGPTFAQHGWKHAQEVIWEKHNGSNFHADRFKRVHEIPVHFYRGAWADLYVEPQVTLDAAERTVVKREKGKPTHHLGARGDVTYKSEDGGPRLMRSVIRVRSEHGRAVHPTQKPTGILRPLIGYSCPPRGEVLDPFMGSGSTLIAARELGRRAVGIETNEAYVEAAIARLAQAPLPVGAEAA